MKILFVAANPRSSGRLSLDEEIRKIQAEIIASSFRDDISFVSLMAARPADLIRALNRERPEIVHFSGHGSQIGELVFSADDGEIHPVAPNDLCELFGTLESPPKLVVLNSCYSFQQVDSLVSVVDDVIGFPNEIVDADATVFAGQLYGALSEGVTVFNSYRQAIIGTRLVNKNCWQNGAPEIMNKPGTSTAVVLVPPRIFHIASGNSPKKIILTDRVTGREFIRRGFDEFCRAHQKLSIVFVDIDGMNGINTRHGRKIGDRIIAETLLEIEDKSAQAIAFGICGDDTFFCIYENDNRAEVMRLARQLMVDIETRDWGRIALGLYVRVEGGFAIWQKNTEEPAELVVRAAAGLKLAQADRITFSEGSNSIAIPYLAKLQPHRREVSEELLRELFS